MDIVKKVMKKYFERKGNTTKPSPSDGGAKGGGGRMVSIAEIFRKNPEDTPHPNPLPQGERGYNF
jgi:hypothetical protein